MKFNEGTYYDDRYKHKVAHYNLYEFFMRPNQELIELLHSTGHTYFNQFVLFEDADYKYVKNSHELIQPHVSIYSKYLLE